MRICMGCMKKLNEDIRECPACGYTQGTPPKEVYHMQPETVLNGKYVVGRVLGYGGFGVTYLGWDAQLERKVAIKEYLPTDFSTRMPGETQLSVYHGEAHDQFEAGLKRFVDEAQRLAKFNKLDGVVDIYDTFVENNTGYIVMQFLDGQTVKDVIKANGSIPYDTALEIVTTVLKTLAEVHKEGVIHRDLSPDNIFITKKNEVKLLDFGAARYATTFHSKSLSVILKPGYAPEEQYRSRGNQGSWSDIYALAATFYKMLTGITPDEAMERAMKDNVQPPSKLGVKISPSAENAIMNAMNVRIEERTQTAEEFLAALQSEEVKRVEPKKVKHDAGKFPLWLKIVSAAMGVAVITVGILSVSGVIRWTPGDFLTFGGFVSAQVNAPGVVNKMSDVASKEVESVGLILQEDDAMFSDKVPKNKIVSQAPLSGRLMNKGDAIYVVISKGSEAEYIAEQEAAAMLGMVSVPFVSRLSEEEAITQLQDVELVAVVAERREDNSVAAGRVISQSIESGTAVEKGTVVNLVISLGRKDAPTPTPTPTPGNVQTNRCSICNSTAHTTANHPAERCSICNSTAHATANHPRCSTCGSTDHTVHPVDRCSICNSTAHTTANHPKCATCGSTDHTVHPSSDPTGVSISGSTTVIVGQSISLSASVQPSNANNKTVTWSSGNPGVATVDSNGRVSGHAAGRAQITAKTSNGITSTHNVTVEPPPVD